MDSLDVMDAAVSWDEPVELAAGEVLLRRSAAAVEVTFNRPDKHNAFTEAMYDALEAFCAETAAAPDLRAVIFQGAGERAFAAGNDITSFTGFASGADGVAYEARIRRVIGAIVALPQVTIAAVEGYCVGGGLAVAAACDLRLATPDAQFGYPIARTLGNALSATLVLRARDVFGDPLTREMILASRLIDAERAHAAGAVVAVVPPEDLAAQVDSLVADIAAGASLTVQLTKDQLRDGRVGYDPAVDETRLAVAYGSAEFRRRVAAFVQRRSR